jgi:hypothetical protein
METSCINWLFAGDPSIRWQVMRDLLDESPEIVNLERAKVASTGWGTELLARQNPDGNWGNGVYNPKWTSTTYILLLLRQLGLPSGHPQALRGCENFFFRGIEKDGGINLFKSMQFSETCINGMILTLLCYFDYPDPRVHSIVEFLIHDQMPDGGWNCRRLTGATHSSFHTTISVLEGLREYCLAFPQKQESIQLVLDDAHEFLLTHHLYQSHRTGKPADPAMTLMHFPPRWHYDFLRGLDYFQSIDSYRDARFNAAIDLLLEKRAGDGRWILNKPWSGKIFFSIEETGEPSRWNTLRALRVLKWWENQI